MTRRHFKSRYLAALKARDVAQDAIYAAAYPRRDVVFSECRKLADAATVAAYDAAFSTLYQLDIEADQSGRAFQAREAARSLFYSVPAST